MRKVSIFVNAVKAAELIEHNKNSYELSYVDGYQGHPISLTLPVEKKIFKFNQFPNYFEGLLPEGIMLEALLKTKKIDRDDLLTQLITVGQDLVGHTTVKVEE